MTKLREAIVVLGSDHRMLLGALAGAVAFHGGLLATGTYRRTYDAYVHIFFADHYVRGWFETWEPRWYTGFTVTSYPPGTHQLVALCSRLIGLEAAFVIVQLAGVLLVIVGVYRVTEMIATRRAAGFAAALTVLSTSVGEAVHVFGQLPTVCSLGALLNALPFVYRWVVFGDRRHLVAATAMLAGTTALHHVTTLFGAVFFLGPVVATALVERLRTPHPGESRARPSRVGVRTFLPLAARRLRRIVRPLGRAAVLGSLVGAVLVAVVLPYWLWSSTDPISQVPIPHASRENFLRDLNAGLVFWAIPWGLMLAAVPHAFIKGLRTTAWPFVASLGLLTLLGTGGTTPIPRMLLGGAFDILTLDRFTFWATVLVLPFAGSAVDDLVHGELGRRMIRVFGRSAVLLVQGTTVVALVAAAVFTSNLTHFRRMQPERIDPAPIVSFLEKDQHDRWRYLTLGFGDQMAWLSAQTTAQTVDGNYHSARRLPELISTPVERLEGAKFRGVPGLGSLQQFLGTPERYHLKYVFSNDQFYDPLLAFSGWRVLQRLENGVVVWEREDVPPLPAAMRRPEPPGAIGLLWGLLPPTALLAAAGAATAGWWKPRPPRGDGPVVTRLEGWLGRSPLPPALDGEAAPSWKEPLQRLARRLQPSDSVVRACGMSAGAVFVVTAGLALVPTDPGPVGAIEDFYADLHFRHFEDAWERLYPADRPPLDEYLLRLSVEDGLFDSYAALDSVVVNTVRRYPGGATAEVELSWVTSLAEFRVTEQVELVDDGGWWLRLAEPDPSEPSERLARMVEVAFEAPGRRTVTTAHTEYDDVLDRPELDLGPVRLVLADGRPVVVGEVRNRDADPGSLTVSASVFSRSGARTLSSNARQVIQHSLLPGEWTPYRIDFEGVAGMATGDFDPTEFTAAELPVDSDSLRIDAAAVVTTRGLDRPLSVQHVRAIVDESGGVMIEGEVLNLGVADVTVAGLLASLYDLEGELIWVDWLLVSESAGPGLSARFEASLTARHRLKFVDLPVAGFDNGLPASFGPRSVPAIPLPIESGYSGLSLTAVAFQRSSR